MKQKETLHLLTLGLHVTQDKFVTRILLKFHKSLMMLTILAEWPMYMEMIQKLLLFVSHMYIVVMHLTATHLHTCTNMTFWLGSQSWTSQLLQCTCAVLIILLHVKCKESSAVIKLQMAYTGVSIITNYNY